MPAKEPSLETLNLESVAQRILALTELATQEHLKALSRSQADRLLTLVQDEAAADRQHAVAVCG